MKKTIITALTVAITVLGAYSQTTQPAPQHMERGGKEQEAKKTPEERAKEMTDQMNTVVQLSSDQYQRVLELNKSFAMKRVALKMENATANDNKLKALKQEKRDQVKAILTAEQLQKWDAHKKANHHKHHKGKKAAKP